MDNGIKIYKFYTDRMKHRIQLIKEEISSKCEEDKQPHYDDSASYVPSQDSEMTEHEVEPKAELEKAASKRQKDFDMSLKRGKTEGSMVLEQYDYSDIKKVLKERLTNYLEAINYCMQIGQDSGIVEQLEQKADMIKHFVKAYKHQNEDEYLELIVKLPRDVTPEDIYGKNKRAEFVKHIQYIEKVIPQIQKERNKMLAIYKKQNDGISKENAQKLIKLLKEQEGVKDLLLKLAGNRWQPLPDLFITEVHFPVIEEKDKSGGKNFVLKLILVSLNLKISLPPSYEKSFFAYYFRIRLLNQGKESIDTREVPITSLI
jgi:hypothetical protein